MMLETDGHLHPKKVVTDLPVEVALFLVAPSASWSHELAADQHQTKSFVHQFAVVTLVLKTPFLFALYLLGHMLLPRR